MTIVLGYVPGAEGQAALRAAIRESARTDQRLVVVNTTRDAGSERSRLARGEDFDRLNTQLRSSGVEYELHRFESAQLAADDVLDVAEKVDASLIVVGLRKQSAVGKLLLGSTAQRILLDASCPVLAVKE